ncbi:MAG: glycine cleavage system aminomethyltransferase GcvT [Candidatus Omnitrophica bacterium]|nr:glycine cleavage system aminomethyltransferase GcvT [Candidatus Omnitrophota bacterium]
MQLKTSLYNKHIENKAKIIDFAGWALPLEYDSSLREAKSTRLSCGLFDASHMGEIRIIGEGAFRFLQRLTSNDISLTKKGQLQYNLFINNEGGIIDDFMLYNFGESFLCVVNASNIQKDYKWLSSNSIKNVEIIDESLDTSLLSLQGPKAFLVLGEIFGKQIQELTYMHFVETFFENKKIIISRSGYTGEDGFELYCRWEDAINLWDLILEKGKKYNLKLCGLGARDILRIEAGYPLYGHEISDKIDPFSASLEWVVKLDKDFIGKEKLLEIKEKIKYKRVGFLMEEPGLARQDYKIFNSQKMIGWVSSGTYSPNLDKFIGMAFVEKEIELDSKVEIKIRDKFYKAKIVSFSFIKRTPSILKKK